MDWTVIGALGLFGLGLIGLVINTNARYLSIREYETYNSFITRELDSVHNRLNTLEQTRPTTGELEAKLERMRNGK